MNYSIQINVYLIQESLNEGCCSDVFCTLREGRSERYFDVSWSERHDYAIPQEFSTREEGNARYRELLSYGAKRWTIEGYEIGCDYPGLLTDIFQKEEATLKRIIEEAFREFEII